MAFEHHTRRFARTEEAIITLFCLVDDAYRLLNPRLRPYESLKRLSDSEVIALALFQQLRSIESERSFLRDAERYFIAPVPWCGGASSFFVPPAGEEAAALLGALAAGCRVRTGWGPRDPAR